PGAGLRGGVALGVVPAAGRKGQDGDDDGGDALAGAGCCTGAVAHSLRDPDGTAEANAPASPRLTALERGPLPEADGDRGALARHAVDLHRPPVAGGQPPHDGETQAAAAHVLVGAVERLEGTLEHVALHADARIADLHAMLLH